MKNKVITAVGITVGAVGSVALAPLVISAVGFTSAGIAAGSAAATMMSSAAIANGGGIAAGSLVALLQSAGAAGLTTGMTVAAASVGGVVGGAVSQAATLLTWFRKKHPPRLPEVNTTSVPECDTASFSDTEEDEDKEP